MNLKLVIRDEEISKGYSTRVYLKNENKYIDPKKVKFEATGAISVGDNGFVIAYDEGQGEIFATYRKEVASVKINVIKERKVFFVGHRGAQPKNENETSIPNTKIAFELGASRKTYGIETDLRISPDHVFYCHHDGVITTTLMNFQEDELAKLNIAIDTDINTIEYTTLKKLHPYWLNGERKDITKIALFKEYIDVCKKNNKKCILEFKATNGINANDQSFVDEAVEMMKKEQWYEHTIFITFVWEVATYLREHYADAEIQLLTGPNTTDQKAVDWCKEHEASIDAYYGKMTEEIINQIHENYLYVNVWTVNDQAIADELLAKGVDIITSDKLEGK